MAALATVDRVAAKIGEPIETPEEIASANEMLESASDWVRFYAGQDTWTAETAPGIAITIAIAAAARGYLNPAGYDEERADASTFKRGDEGGWSIGAKPTPDEIAALRTFNTNSRGRITSVPMTNPERFRARSDRVKVHDFEVGYQEPFSTGS